MDESQESGSHIETDSSKNKSLIKVASKEEVLLIVGAEEKDSFFQGVGESAGLNYLKLENDGDSKGNVILRSRSDMHLFTGQSSINLGNTNNGYDETNGFPCIELKTVKKDDEDNRAILTLDSYRNYGKNTTSNGGAAVLEASKLVKLITRPRDLPNKDYPDKKTPQDQPFFISIEDNLIREEGQSTDGSGEISIADKIKLEELFNKSNKKFFWQLNVTDITPENQHGIYARFA